MSEKKRSIFEDVGGPKTAPVRPAGGLIDRGRSGARLGIRAWLVVLFLLVVAMIVVGGLTRLTDSGLSITEWKPLMAPQASLMCVYFPVRVEVALVPGKFPDPSANWFGEGSPVSA